jgi:type IV pilus assembly protein PilQ
MKKITVIISIFLFMPHTTFGNVRDPFSKNIGLEAAIIQNPQLSVDQTHSEFYRLYYAKAVDVAALLQNTTHALLSSQGHVAADIRTNALWITDTQDHLGQIHQFLQKIDIPANQINITARIVNVDENSLEELGLTLGSSTSKNKTTQNKLQMDMPFSIENTGHFAIALGKLDDAILSLELSALEREGKARIVSSPKLTTIDRQTAIIESGEEIPYQEQTSSGATNISFKKAVLSLKVTPEITAKQQILLNLVVNQDKVSTLSVNGVPAISTQQLQTQVLVSDGETIVLGGIYEESNNRMMEKIPFWSSVPVIGYLFRHKNTHSERKQLLIFVTPHIALS